MSKIKSISAFEILDSRGNPTIQTTVVLSDGAIGISAVPSGASVGTYEAVELRDNDPKRYNGKGVLSAIKNVQSTIAPALIGIDSSEQQKVDLIMIELDGTQTKSKLGANAILSVSQAFAKASARSSLMPLYLYLKQFITQGEGTNKMPTPLFNLLGGGLHANDNIDFQEFLAIPATSIPFNQGLEMGVKIKNSLSVILSEKGLSTLASDEGGFGPILSTNQEAFLLLKQAIEHAGFNFALDVFLGIDAAANHLLDGKEYKLKDKANSYTEDELVDYYLTLTNDYALYYLEDPFGEDDWEGWKKAYPKLSPRTLIVGDDLTTTNPYRLQLAIDNNAINAMIIKPNQIGTITEAMAVVEIAKFKKIKIVVSHRSGETMDDFISDFAVGVGADYVKFGAPARERIAKYNRLLEIQTLLQEFQVK